MADNAFPYRVCGGQQDSGSVCVASRGNDGQITFRDWHPVGVEEYGYAAPDPLDPDLVYGGKVTRYDRRTGQVSDVGPSRDGVGRRGGAASRISHRSHAAGRLLHRRSARALLRQQRALEDHRRRRQLEADQPDLTREKWDVPKSVGTLRPPRASARARRDRRAGDLHDRPSYKDINRIWIGTDDGVIYTTADGGLHWTNVTPPQVTDFMKVFTIDPGRFDALTAYAAVNTLRLDDMNPHIYRTHDGGKTWKEIVSGIPAAHRSASSARIRSGRACSSPARKPRSTSRSTMAITGSRCG
jgi:hypothetical protein